MKINIKQAEKLAKHYKINLDIINFDEWHYGLNVELEHGKKFGIITNITNNNLSITAKIVIAHLTEFPDYYKRLLKLETAADKYWSTKKKPNIFLM
jgi:hypothetical protein